ncbi:MafI family immunity protein [Camelimonas sp. ID_303_24]
MNDFSDKILLISNQLRGKAQDDTIIAVIDYVNNKESYLAMETLISFLSEDDTSLDVSELAAVLMLANEMKIDFYIGELINLINNVKK